MCIIFSTSFNVVLKLYCCPSLIRGSYVDVMILLKSTFVRWPKARKRGLSRPPALVEFQWPSERCQSHCTARTHPLEKTISPLAYVKVSAPLNSFMAFLKRPNSSGTPWRLHGNWSKCKSYTRYTKPSIVRSSSRPHASANERANSSWRFAQILGFALSPPRVVKTTWRTRAGLVDLESILFSPRSTILIFSFILVSMLFLVYEWDL